MLHAKANNAVKPIAVLYEDDDYVVFEKPAGLLVVPSPKKEKNTLLTRVNRQFPSEKEFRLYPCHRLDRDTSGVILFAKGEENQRIMMQEFKRQNIGKVYTAFVQGHLKNPNGEIKSFIKDFEQIKFNRKSPGKLSVTRYKVLQKKRGFSVVEVYPLTGRTNQIRIHFSEIGHPVVGERKYAFGKDYDLKFRRTALHASRLQWFHPVQKKKIEVFAPLAEDMERFLLQH